MKKKIEKTRPAPSNQEVIARLRTRSGNLRVGRWFNGLFRAVLAAAVIAGATMLVMSLVTTNANGRMGYVPTEIEQARLNVQMLAGTAVVAGGSLLFVFAERINAWIDGELERCRRIRKRRVAREAKLARAQDDVPSMYSAPNPDGQPAGDVTVS